MEQVQVVRKKGIKVINRSVVVRTEPIKAERAWENPRLSARQAAKEAFARGARDLYVREQRASDVRSYQRLQAEVAAILEEE